MNYMDAQAAQALESQLKNLTLASFHGENVPKCNQEITRILQLLYSANYYRPDMLGTVLRIYTDSKQPSFVHWAFGKKQEIDRYIALCQQYRNDERNVPGGRVTFTSILDEAQKHYDAEALNKTWKPMRGVKDTPAEPDVPGANTATAKKQKEEFIAAVATAVGKAMKNNGGNNNNTNTSGNGNGNSGGSRKQRRRNKNKGQQQGGGEGTQNSNSNTKEDEYCNWCGNKACPGKKGYPQCPHKDKEWYTIPPVRGQDRQRMRYSHMTKQNTLAIWCDKCKKWRYKGKGGHKTGDHDKWKQEQKKWREAQANQAQHDEEEEEEEEEQEPSDVEPEPFSSDEEETTTGENQQQDQEQYNFFEPWAGVACEWNEV